ncbi:glycosyltransferase family 4 protein [bacterium]|nr:glycosyltransferase family 4 protein [bacterium]
MNILLVNTFHYNRGGDCVYNFKLAELLRKMGNHNIIHFAMHHSHNFRSVYEKYFVPEIDFLDELKKGGIASGLKVVKRAIYSKISKKKLTELLDQYPVDIAHIQNIRGHITPSIFHILRKRGIPIIWTQHDYFLMCPNSSFYTHGEVCEACVPKKFYKVCIRKCRKDSLKASIVVMLEDYAYRFLGLLKLVDTFIAPSTFLRTKMIDSGFPSDKIVHLPNFIDTDENITLQDSGNYLLYVGRLSYEKGIKTLIEAVSSKLNIKLLVAGDGPIRKELEDFKCEMSANNVEFLGYVNQEKIPGLIKSSEFAVVPSEWYENFPYSILEAFAYGKPVVGSNIGGITELVKDGDTGLLFEPGNTEDLEKKILWMLEHREESKAMGVRARQLIEEEYNPEKHYRALMKIYEKALEKHGKSLVI